MSVVQKRNSELVEILRPDFVGNDGTASPTFTDEYLTGSHRASISVGVRVYRNVAQVIGSGAWTNISFTHQRWDDPDNNQWAIGTPTQLVCQIDGMYVVSGNVRWDTNLVGGRGLRIDVNATVIAYVLDNVSGGFTVQSVSSIYKLSVGDLLHLGVLQSSGGNLNVLTAANYSPEFSMVRVP